MKEKINKIYITIWLFFLYSLSCQSINDFSDTTNKIFSIGLKFHYSYLFIHTKDLIPNDDYYPWGIEINLNWHLIGKKVWEQCNCYPRNGIIISFFDFDKPSILGYGYTVAYYLEPYFSYKAKVNPSMRASAGLSYLTRPYHPIDNPHNNAYSMRINAYLMLNLGLNYRINKNWNLNFSVNYNHNSNGGIKDPNKGINFPSISLSADYILKPTPFIKREKTKFIKHDKQNFKMSLSFFGAGRVLSHINSKMFFVYGPNLNLSLRISKLSALSLGTEWFVDYILKEKLELAGLGNRDYNRGGITFGHEFLLGKFIFSQQLGVYYYNPSRFSDVNLKHKDPVYQRYGLFYKINKYLVTGICLKAHRNVANFLDMRIGVMLK